MKAMLDNKRFDQVDNFTYLGSITNNDGRCSEDIKRRITEVQSVFHGRKEFEIIGEISLRTKIRLLEATVMTVVS